MKAKLSTLDKYKLVKTSYGYEWTDLRDDTGIVYNRDFSDAWSLGNFLEEFFGLRVAKRIWKEKADILP